MRKILSRLMFAAVLLLAAVYLLTGQKTFRIRGAESIRLSSGSTGQSVVLTDPELVQRITSQIDGLRWKAAGSAQDVDGWTWRITWSDRSGKQLEEITVLEDDAIVSRGRKWIPFAAGIDTSSFEDCF